MTHPKIIGHLTGCGELNRPDQRELAKYASLVLGIDSMPMRKDDPIRDALKHVINRAGYRVMLDGSRCHPYDPWSYVTGMDRQLPLDTGYAQHPPSPIAHGCLGWYALHIPNREP